MFENTSHVIDGAGQIGVLWCAIMHDSPTWPIHGKYQCRTCGRLYAVPWAGYVRLREQVLAR